MDKLGLLGRVVVYGGTDFQFPTRLEVEAWCQTEPWLLDELLRDGLVKEKNGRLIPTVSGLKQNPIGAEDKLKWALRLQETIQRLSVGPHEEHEIAEADGWTTNRPRNLIPYLLGILLFEDVFSGVDGDGGGRINKIYIQAHHRVRTATVNVSDFSSVHLRVHNFRVLATVDWKFGGVCLVGGPNGSGKTTLLRNLEFLRDAFQRGIAPAINLQGGTGRLLYVNASEPAIEFRVVVGEVEWFLKIGIEGGGISEFAEEEVRIGGQVHIRRSMYAQEWYMDLKRLTASDGRTCLRMAWDAQQTAALRPLVNLLNQSRFYAGYNLDAIRSGGESDTEDKTLSPSGRNLFHLLRNWRAAPRRFEGQFDWVLTNLKAAFPGLVDDMELDVPIGSMVQARYYTPGHREPFSLYTHSADGMLVGLLHLVAVAGAPTGGIVAIDEMENQLHPHAIRTLLSAMRERAKERQLTIILSTHSPVLMNEFQDNVDQFFIMEPKNGTVPTRLSDLKNPDWLSQFSLGDLYERGKIGVPRGLAE